MQADKTSDAEYYKENLAKAKKGDAEAQYMIGMDYDMGSGVKRNSAEAIKWYRKAAEQGQKDAQFSLGLAYEKGYSTKKNEAEAIKWYRKAAEQGVEAAQERLYGLDPEVRKKLREAAEKGDVKTQIKLGDIYYFGRGAAEDKKEAAKWYRMAAERGDVYAQCDIGQMYQFGIGVAEDKKEAAKWYRLAAEQGDKSACFSLGLIYEDIDKAEAEKWYRLSGDKLAHERLVKLNMSDQEKARARAMENSKSDFNRGNDFYRSKGYIVAEESYREAAKQGHAGAQYMLGLMYDNGQGVKKDYAEAMKWYRMAADQGNADAQNNLGVMYQRGQGVARNDVEALEWYRKAAAQGDATAQDNVRKLEPYVAAQAAQVAAAQQYQQNQQPPAGYAVQQMPVMPTQMPMGGMPMSYPSYYPTTDVGMAERQSMINGQMAQIIGQQRMQMLNTNFQIQNAAMQQQFAEQTKTLDMFLTNESNAAKKLEDAKNSGDAIAKAQQEYNDAVSARQTCQNMQSSMNQNNINFMNSMTQDAAASDQRSREIVRNAQQEADAKIQAQRAQDSQFKQDQWNQEQVRLNEAAADAARANKMMTQGKWVETPGARDINNQTMQQAEDHQTTTPGN